MGEVVISRDVCRSFSFDTDDCKLDRMAKAATLAVSTHAPMEAVLKHHPSVGNGREGKSQLNSLESGKGGGGGYSLEAVAHVRAVCVQARRPLRDDPDPNASYLAPKHWIKMLPNDDEGTKAPWAGDLAAAAAVKFQRRSAAYVYQEEILTTRDKQERVLVLTRSGVPKVGVTFQSAIGGVIRANAFSNIMRGVKAKVATSHQASTKFEARTKLTPFDSPQAFERRLDDLDKQFEQELRLKALQVQETKELSALSGVAERQPRGSATSQGPYSFPEAVTTVMNEHGITAPAKKMGKDKGASRTSCVRSEGGGARAVSLPSNSFQKRQQMMGIDELRAASAEAGAGSKQEVMLWAQVRGDVGPRRRFVGKRAVSAPLSAPLVRRSSRTRSAPLEAAAAAAAPSPSPARAVAKQRDAAAWVRPLSGQLARLGQLGAHNRHHSASSTQNHHHQSRWVGAGSCANSTLGVGSAVASLNDGSVAVNERSHKSSSSGGGHVVRLAQSLSLAGSLSSGGGGGSEGFDKAGVCAQSSVSTLGSG